VPVRTPNRCINVLFSGSAVFSDDMSGHTDIIDGDTLEIHGTRTRLWGIDAPESSQLRRGGR
jgi:endonuclease YncB( thermonuclease family)